MPAGIVGAPQSTPTSTEIRRRRRAEQVLMSPEARQAARRTEDEIRESGLDP